MECGRATFDATVPTAFLNVILFLIITIGGIHSQIVHKNIIEMAHDMPNTKQAPRREYYHRISETQTKEHTNDDEKREQKAKLELKNCGRS